MTSRSPSSRGSRAGCRQHWLRERQLAGKSAAGRDHHLWSLCSITYDPLGRRAAWSRALGELGLDSEFLHRNELLRRHGPVQPPLPAVFAIRNGRPELLIASTEIEAAVTSTR